MAIENRRQTRKEYSFKSVGRSKREAESREERALRPPIGIKTPIQLSNTDGIFSMHRDLADQVSDNLKNLILTNHGERLGGTEETCSWDDSYGLLSSIDEVRVHFFLCGESTHSQYAVLRLHCDVHPIFKEVCA